MESNLNRVKIFLRIRPPLEREISKNSFTQCINTKYNVVYISKINKATVLNSDIENFEKIETYCFDHVFNLNSTQLDILEKIGRPSIRKIIEGYNSTLFAYGQTGSGKTYSIEGDNGKPGLLPLILEELFQIRIETNEKFSFTMSAVQLYMEKITDLISPKEKELNLKKKDDGFEINHLYSIYLDSPQHGMEAFRRAQSKRIFASTKMNDTSSRGHVIYTISVLKESSNGKEIVRVLHAKLNLVDLAGSERISKSGTTGQNLKESISINKSLYCLQGVVDALVNPKSVNYKNPPFRDSKLTMILKDSLGGNSITYLLANISPSFTEVNETISTLNFANSCKMIINNPVKNEIEKLLKEQKKIKQKAQTSSKSVINKDIEMPWRSLKVEYIYKSVINEYGEIFYLDNNINFFKEIIILLHGCPSNSTEFICWLPALTYYGYKVIAIDQPGYGRTSGTCHPCNSKYNLDKGGPCDIVISVINSLNIKEKVIIGGYDWGAGISLSLCTKYPNLFSKIIVFMPSYSEPTGNELKLLPAPVLIIWVDLDQFHVWSKWKKLADKIPKRTTEIIKLKLYDRSVYGECYSNISDKIMRPIIIFLGEADPLSENEFLIEPIKKKITDTNGNNVEARLNINFIDDIKDQSGVNLLRNQLKSEEIFLNEFMELYKSIGSNIYELFLTKEKEVCKIFRGLPEISYDILNKNPSYLVQLGVWNNLPKNYNSMINRANYFNGRKVFILIPCSPNVKINGKLNKNYLIYDPLQKEKFLSYSGIIKGYNAKTRFYSVETYSINGDTCILNVEDNEIYLYNNRQEFFTNNLNEVELEDGIRANYQNPLVKAKMIEISMNLARIIEKMDFEDDSIEYYQEQAIKAIRKSLNLISFYRGVVRERHGRTECIGKLAVNGQAQCHGLSSTVSGYLYPFSKILGIDLLYRGGYSFLNSINDDEVTEIAVSNKIEKHQWLQVNLKPKMSAYICDIWYQEQFNDDNYLFLKMEKACQYVSYPHPKLLLKNRITQDEYRE